MKKITKILIAGLLSFVMFVSIPVDAKGYRSNKIEGKGRNKAEVCVNQQQEVRKNEQQRLKTKDYCAYGKRDARPRLRQQDCVFSSSVVE
ncbi:MAG: hypothetical protein GX326_04075 [Clostridiaceae bacterium]|nr:hypothetical protein [Clostridiaceae bacterium]